MMQVIAQRLTIVWLAEYKLWCKLWISLLVGFYMRLNFTQYVKKTLCASHIVAQK